MIYILTGQVHSGKTTAIQKWIGGSQNIGGFLSPDIGSARHLLNIRRSETIPFQVGQDHSGETVSVGPYTFSKHAFFEAGEWTIEDLKNDKIDWIIIDELGKLELKKLGFYKLARDITKREFSKNLLLVIRDFLVDPMIELLDLTEYKIISLTDLGHIEK